MANEFGRLLAAGAVAHGVSVEGALTMSPVFPHPVALEPEFSAFDPAQSFVVAVHRGIVNVPRPVGWVTRRVLLSGEPVDLRRAEGFIAGLAGSAGPISFEVFAQRSRATVYLGAGPGEIGFVMATWLAAYPQSVLVEAADPWDAIAAVQLLYDLYSPAPYHRSLRSSQVSPWAQFFGLCALLPDDEISFVQYVFSPARHNWQQNIAGMLVAERGVRATLPARPHRHSENSWGTRVCRGAPAGRHDPCPRVEYGGLGRLRHRRWPSPQLPFHG